jgi:hypothetical protein
LSDSEIHAGYEFEEGMFSRMRSWIDVAPWIRLVRVLRILASPLNVGIVAIALALTKAVSNASLGRTELSPVWDLKSNFDRVVQIFTSGGLSQTTAIGILLFLVWVPVVQTVCRGGAMLTAGKSLPGVWMTMRVTFSRLWKSYVVGIVPWICVFGFCCLLFLIRLPSLFWTVPAVSASTGWIIGVSSVPIGILGFGALVAIPLGLVAMVNEPDPDPIDSLSRGYEYLYRRPLSLVWYVSVSFVLVYLAGYLLRGIGLVSSWAVLMIVSMISPDAIQFATARDALSLIVSAWQLTLMFALLGGVYLLLRRDAGGQEVEDLWTPPSPPSQLLPDLPEQAYRS